MEEVKVYKETMDVYTFTAPVISGHRVTIRDDIFKDLGLTDGDKVRVTVRKVKKHMREHAVVTED